MLNKRPEARPSIRQVKDHRWLLDQPLIRETLTQSLEITPLPDDEEAPSKGYVVISKHNEQIPEIKSVKKQRLSAQIPELEKSVRMSETNYQDTILKLNTETATLGQEIGRVAEVIKTRKGLVDGLVASISQKAGENRQLAFSEREQLEKLAALNAELEKVHRLDHSANINEELKKVQQSSFEVQSSLARKQALYASHLQELKRKSEQVRSLEQQISMKSSQLLALKNELLQIEREPKITELHLQSDIMRTRLVNLERMSRPLSSSDAAAAEAVKEAMGMRVRTIKGLDEAETLERIESLEEAAMKLDNQISQASFEHEEEKSRILASLRAKKEEIMHNAVSIKHQRETAKAQEIAEQKAALEREISQLHQVSRTDSLGLTTLRKQTEQLQLTARQETERVCELLRRRETLHREAELQQKKIEETEIELGLLKGRVFAMD
jgi:hypothetical protein